jgi:hypothetical protein
MASVVTFFGFEWDPIDILTYKPTRTIAPSESRCYGSSWLIKVKISMEAPEHCEEATANVIDTVLQFIYPKNEKKEAHDTSTVGGGSISRPARSRFWRLADGDHPDTRSTFLTLANIIVAKKSSGH